MAETAISPRQSHQRSALERGVDKVWRFFTSVRNAIYEIAFLTLLVLIGTLRGSSAPQWLADHLPFLQPLVDRWYAWDVFRSPVFAITLAVIAIAIIICTLNRVPQIWATFAHPKITTSMGFINGADTAAEFALASPKDDVLKNVTGVLEKSRWRVLTETKGDTTHIYADKNRYSGFGTFPFHIGLILLLVGGIVASSMGFRDNEFLVAEGERKNIGHGTGMYVELNRVRDVWNEQGLPVDYVSEVTIYDGSNAVKSGDARVNHPVSEGPATVYQSSFGTTAEIIVRDSQGNIVFGGPAYLGRYNSSFNTQAPADIVDIPAEGLRLSVIAPDPNAVAQPEMNGVKLKSGEIWIGELGDTEGVILTQGQPMQFGDYTITFEREGRYSILQIGYNPAIPIFLIAAGFLIGGLIITFYFPHRRIRGMLKPGEDGNELHLAPLAKRDYAGKRDFYNVLGKLTSSLDASPKVRAPKNEGDYEYLYKQARSGNQSL